MSVYNTTFCIECDNLWSKNDLQEGKCVFCFNQTESHLGKCLSCKQEDNLYYKNKMLKCLSCHSEYSCRIKQYIMWLELSKLKYDKYR